MHIHTIVLYTIICHILYVWGWRRIWRPGNHKHSNNDNHSNTITTTTTTSTTTTTATATILLLVLLLLIIMTMIILLLLQLLTIMFIRIIILILLILIPQIISITTMLILGRPLPLHAARRDMVCFSDLCQRYAMSCCVMRCYVMSRDIMAYLIVLCYIA